MVADAVEQSTVDPVSNILKWVLLLVAIGTFACLGWATWETYRAAPPQPDRYVTADGAVVMTNADIVAGKAGFQRADLMDYGSLYGMGSYFGEDYTASNLVALATLTQAQYRHRPVRQALRGPEARAAVAGPRRHAGAAPGAGPHRQTGRGPAGARRRYRHAARPDQHRADARRLRQGLDARRQPGCDQRRCRPPTS